MLPEMMNPDEVAALIELLKKQEIHRQNLFLVNRKVNDILLEARENGVTENRGHGEPWSQPTGFFGAYLMGDVVSHDGLTEWRSTISGNVWEPGVNGWRELPSNGGPPEWKPLNGLHEAFVLGEETLFEGVVYVSIIDGNMWSPGEYPNGWEEKTPESDE